MTQKYTVEALLRPPVEFYSCIMMALAAITSASAPSIFFVPTHVAYSAAGLLGIFSLWRFRQGYKVIVYQRGLRKAPSFKMARSKIPVNPVRIYFGKGFRWTGKHTQRLHDAREESASGYVNPTGWIRALRRIEIDWEESRYLSWLTSITRFDNWLNPARPLPDIGGDPVIHGVGVGEEEPVYETLVERNGHMVVEGSTGVGKTRLAELFITQDIRRKNNCVVVLDPKGDADLLLTTYLEARRSNRKCYVFHLGFPEFSAKYNAVGTFSRITEIPTRISSPLPGDGDAAAFREFVWQFVNVIVVAVINLGEVVDYELIKRYMRQIDPLLVKYGRYWLNKKFSDWESEFSNHRKGITQKSINNTPFKSRDFDAVAMYYTLQHYKAEDSIIAGLLYAFQYDKTYFDKITNAVGPFLEKLTSGKISQILSPAYDENDFRPRIDWEEVLRQEAVVYVGLDALTDPEVASAVGSSMFSDLTSLAGRKTKFGMTPGIPNIGKERNPSLVIHGDEFNDLIGPHMVTLLNKSRSADYHLNLYTQTWSDVEAKLGSAAKAGQIAGNLNTMIMMRVKELATAEMLTNQLPETNVSTIMAVSGVDDGNPNGDGGIDFKSRNEDRISNVRVPLIEPSEIVALPRGQAFLMKQGSHLYKIRIPLIDKLKPGKGELPDHVRQMVASMRTRYKSTDGWYYFTDSVDIAQLGDRHGV